jgi:hypothetical protein
VDPYEEPNNEEAGQTPGEEQQSEEPFDAGGHSDDSDGDASETEGQKGEVEEELLDGDASEGAEQGDTPEPALDLDLALDDSDPFAEEPIDPQEAVQAEKRRRLAERRASAFATPPAETVFAQRAEDYAKIKDTPAPNAQELVEMLGISSDEASIHLPDIAAFIRKIEERKDLEFAAIIHQFKEDHRAETAAEQKAREQQEIKERYRASVEKLPPQYQKSLSDGKVEKEIAAVLRTKDHPGEYFIEQIKKHSEDPAYAILALARNSATLHGFAEAADDPIKFGKLVSKLDENLAGRKKVQKEAPKTSFKADQRIPHDAHGVNSANSRQAKVNALTARLERVRLKHGLVNNHETLALEAEILQARRAITKE